MGQVKRIEQYTISWVYFGVFVRRHYMCNLRLGNSFFFFIYETKHTSDKRKKKGILDSTKMENFYIIQP